MLALSALLLFTAAMAPADAGPCLVLGDSIAVRLGPFEPGCTLAAKNGLTAADVLAIAPADAGFARVIVSVGSNGRHSDPPLADSLDRLRRRYPSARFAWLAPRKGDNAVIVAAFGARHHDQWSS